MGSFYEFYQRMLSEQMPMPPGMPQQPGAQPGQPPAQPGMPGPVAPPVPGGAGGWE